MTNSLIPCKACGKNLSTQATTCPYCGHPAGKSTDAKANDNDTTVAPFLCIVAVVLSLLLRPSESTLRSAVVKKSGDGFTPAIREMLGTQEYIYHNYWFFSTLGANGVWGGERKLATGFLGMTFVHYATLDEALSEK